MRYKTKYKSPIGDLLLLAEDESLVGLYFEQHTPAPKDTSGKQDKVAFVEVIEQLEQFFAGERTEFDLSLRLSGTSFQEDVWRQLRKIAFGDTITYGEIAKRCDRPRAVRAVGAAVGRNPISIIVPCHRVVGANGSLTGFAGGTDRKRSLLDLEMSAYRLVG